MSQKDLHDKSSNQNSEADIVPLRYTPTQYISEVSHYAILPENWKPGALPT